MPFVNLPEWEAREIVTAAKLQQYTTALQSFAAGSADIAWPLTAGGSLDFDSLYTIDNLRVFWNIINAAEYESETDSLQAAIDAAESAGGGLVLIPPYTTLSTTGVTVQSDKVAVVGCGPSSIIALSSSASGPAITLGASAAAYSDLVVANLTIDGSAGAAGSDGISILRIARPKILNVHFSGVKGDALLITNDGTGGNATTDGIFRDLSFSGSGTYDIHVADLSGAQFRGISSVSGADSIYMEPGDTTNSLVQDISLSDVRIESPTGKGISILAGTSVSANWSRINLSNCQVISPTGVGIEIGAASKELRDVSMKNCLVYNGGTDAYNVNITAGKLEGCDISNGTTTPACVGDGIDMISSTDVTVTACKLQDAGAYAVDADGTTNCKVYNNNLLNPTTGSVFRDSVTTLLEGNNLVDVEGSNTEFNGKILGGTIFKEVSHTTSSTSPEAAFTLTIPANTLTKAGDGILVEAFGLTAGSGTATINLEVGGQTVSSSGAYSVDAGNDGFVTTSRSFLNDVGASGSNNTESWGNFQDNDGNGTGIDVFTDTIDWTADVAVVVRVTSSSSGNITVRGVLVQLFEGVEAGT